VYSAAAARASSALCASASLRELRSERFRAETQRRVRDLRAGLAAAPAAAEEPLAGEEGDEEQEGPAAAQRLLGDDAERTRARGVEVGERGGVVGARVEGPARRLGELAQQGGVRAGIGQLVAAGLHHEPLLGQRLGRAGEPRLD